MLSLNTIKKTDNLEESQFSEMTLIAQEYTIAMNLSNLSNETNNNKITFYGGALIKPESTSYKLIFNTAKAFAMRGYSVVSGGGPGAMSASLEGCQAGVDELTKDSFDDDNSGDVCGPTPQTIAYCINLPQEESKINSDIHYVFSFFAPRKYALRQSQVYVFCPGGMGTLDEMCEILDLIKTNKLPTRKIYLLDSDFWSGFNDWLNSEVVVERGLANKEMLNLFKVVDTEEEIIKDYFGVN
jgi:predicted Rossmann-fold nucleotide-binding protein